MIQETPGRRPWLKLFGVLMAKAQFNVPPSVPQHIARAKASLKRGEGLKAVNSLMSALELFEPKKVIGKAKYETEIFIMEVVEDLNRNAKVQEFLIKASESGGPASIPYAPGQENQLYTALNILSKVLQEGEEADEMVLAENHDERRDQLWSKGTALLDKKSFGAGKAVLRRLAEEFGAEPGVNARIGEALVKAKLAAEATEFLETAIRQQPNDHKSYGYLVRSYTELREFEQAEKIYIAALKRFGQHHKTLINFANLYKMWNKREKAYDIARMALRESPGNKEAQAILDWADRRVR